MLPSHRKMTSQPDNLNSVIFGVEGPRLTFWEKAFFVDTQPFGFILFARNVETADQLRALCSDLRTAVGWNAPILIDQEGGRVQRLVPPMATQFLPPLDHAASAGAEALMRSNTNTFISKPYVHAISIYIRMYRNCRNSPLFTSPDNSNRNFPSVCN